MTRQDAWTKEEDLILAKTVLQYIREGKTQLEAFKEVAKQLSRTAAACGFRWNANIRKEHQKDIQQAKDSRKKNRQKAILKIDQQNILNKDPIEAVISLLEKMKDPRYDLKVNKEELESLERENIKLRKKISRYEEAWREMGKIWCWVKENNRS